MPPSGNAELTPREAYARFQQVLLGNAPELADDLYAEDVVVEFPFARPGMRRCFEGRDAFRSFAAAAGGASSPVRFEEFRDVVIHDTTDPEVIIAEYDLAGTVTTTNRQAAESFVLVLRVRAGRIVHLREYQNVLGMAAALGQLPELLTGLDPTTGNGDGSPGEGSGRRRRESADGPTGSSEEGVNT
ncbi:nuclear transport factor 2 family protein [Parafrankia discariae]|uniref:nuclear transport factor 2 family protein n=1 Tax=Parafrankia discariae TaxID=365528 RepID=UPI0003669F0C|nr:nuclear transport factor 2 family protein [Parafrankia discariae]